ncbi:phage tail protein [Escherichia coli]|nr:phage tail protein [Escherichia coli]
MKKARSLREALIKAVPQLETNPEMMRIFADEGNIDARLAASLSHEKIYTLNVIVCDFVGDPDLIFVPVAALLRENQPDICTLDDGRIKGYRFQMDLNDGDSIDISISLQLTERTLIKEENGALHVSYAPEPPLPEPATRPKELYINGELVSKWDE